MKTKYIVLSIVVILVLLTIFALVRKSHVPNTESIVLYSTDTFGGKQGEATSTKATEITKEDNIDKSMQATMHTTKGDITIEFFSDQTPNTVANFVKLAKLGFYNGVKFHRVIKGFMIQGGDPLTKDDSQTANWGRGGPGYTFEDEITPENRNAKGTISMANSGPDTNGSQFFINVAANNFLDTKHTVFGRVTSGMDIVTAIENTPTAPGDRPLEPVTITSITF